MTAEEAEPGQHEEADGSSLPPIPDALLAPLLDSAGEALRRLQPVDLPPAARRLRSFDRRGLATPAARQQLRKLLEEDAGVLTAALTVFRARPEVGGLAEAWDEAIAAGGEAPVNLVSEAAAEGRLPLLASVLTSGLPDCFEFGLGLVVAMDAVAGREAAAADAARAAFAGEQAAEEAARRADAARTASEAQVARLEEALRDERRARRDEGEQAADAAATSAARQAELEAALADAAATSAARQAELEAALADANAHIAEARGRMAQAERRVADGAVSAEADQQVAAERRASEAEHRAADAADRAATAEERARRAETRAAFAEAELAELRAAGGPATPSGAVDRAVLDQIARAAEELAAGVRRLADAPPAAPPPRPQPSPPTPSRRAGAARHVAKPPPPPSPSRSRRAPVRLPPGMRRDDPAAVEAMVRNRGVAVIVDGYNVSMLAWPRVTAAEQRERLCDALAELQLRFRCEVTVVFDGAEVPGVRPLRRRNLRVVFSAAGQEADEVVIGEVVFRPDDVPVIVVSSDREVRAGAEAEGAAVLAADELLALMRR